MKTFDANDLSLISGLTLVVSALIVYYVTSAFYCIYLHPLAKYPGPFFSKFSVWPSYYHSLKGDRYIWMWQCHQIYGSTFRYCPDGLFFNTPQANRDIYEGNANVRKGDFYHIYPRNVGSVNTWNCVDKVKHARKRRILNAAFSDKALKSSEEFIVQHVDRWCELLGDGANNGWSLPRNIAHLSDCLVFDILGELLYARSFNIKESGSNDLKSIPKTMTDYAAFLAYLSRSPFLSTLIWLKPKGLDRLFEIALPKTAKIFLAFSESCLNQRLNEEKRFQEKGIDSGETRKDILHYLFRAKDPQTGGPGYTAKELREESDVLLVAGSDTTSTVFAAMFFYMTRNPKVYKRLTDEIRETFDSADDIRSGSKLNSCRYLRAFINETMRMNPPVPGDLSRAVLPGGITVDGHFLQQGTNIAVGPYSLQHNEDIFRDPFVFKPERWIADDQNGVTAADVAACESAFSPFSIGSRGCPGKQLAYLEMGVVMGKALFQYDVQAVEGDDLGAGSPELIWGRRNRATFQTKDVFVCTREGPMVQFRYRRP